MLWITHTQGMVQLALFNGLVLALRAQRILREVYGKRPSRALLTVQVHCNHFFDKGQRVTCESTELFSDASWAALRK